MSEPAGPHSLGLRDFHTAKGAVLGETAGWRVPLHYGDSEAEYRALRSTAVAFDASQRSRLLVTGTDGGEVLDAALAGHPGEIEEGRCSRATAVDDRGHVSDLALVTRTGGIAWMVIGEPGRRLPTFARLQASVRSDFDARVEDRTAGTCLVGLSGPRSAELVGRFVAEALPARLQPLQSVTFEFHGFRALAIRVSETGEDGFLFVVAPAVALHLFESLTEAGVALAGHQALEVARIEACLPAYEPDLVNGLTPTEAGLESTGAGTDPRRRLVPFLLEEAEPPSPGTPVSRGGTVVGETRSSAWCWGVRSVGGLAIVDASEAAPGTLLDVAGKAATIVAKPIYRRRG